MNNLIVLNEAVVRVKVLLGDAAYEERERERTRGRVELLLPSWRCMTGFISSVKSFGRGSGWKGGREKERGKETEERERDRAGESRERDSSHTG